MNKLALELKRDGGSGGRVRTRLSAAGVAVAVAVVGVALDARVFIDFVKGDLVC